MKDDAMFEQIGDKLYATARAYVVTEPSELPREIASEFEKDTLNPSFLWVAGRYVQANRPNKNGHYWTFDDLQKGEKSIRYTPVNVLHKWDRPVGAYVQTKIVHREDRLEGSDRLLPEIQALAVVWAANFPEVASRIRENHENNTLWYSMECVAESKQCLIDEEVFDFKTPSQLCCEHLATSKTSPRRFINPVFLGGGLIYPPDSPAWEDADITEVAHRLTVEYAERERSDFDPAEWEHLMAMAMNM